MWGRRREYRQRVDRWDAKSVGACGSHTFGDGLSGLDGRDRNPGSEPLYGQPAFHDTDHPYTNHHHDDHHDHDNKTGTDYSTRTNSSTRTGSCTDTDSGDIIYRGQSDSRSLSDHGGSRRLGVQFTVGLVAGWPDPARGSRDGSGVVAALTRSAAALGR